MISKLGTVFVLDIFDKMLKLLSKIQKMSVTYVYCNKFKSVGRNAIFNSFDVLLGGKYIEIGDNCIIGRRAVLTAWSEYCDIKYSPTIKIGSNVSIGDDCHITCINSIYIADNVLIGKKVTITDNSHGDTVSSELSIPPIKRKLYSRGPVFIGENVWIGDKVTILPNVSIGSNSIIGANSVITKDVPSCSICVGSSARVIKKI